MFMDLSQYNALVTPWFFPVIAIIHGYHLSAGCAYA